MLNWIEKRTGFISQAKDFLTEDVPGGASYWYVFGSATMFCMIVQIVTGIFLTFFYAPSAATAWESTRAMYLNPWTHFLLATHYWGASAMIALVFLHLLQTLIWGAYKSPRELQWVVGVLLLLVTLVLGLTGYLLPWDMDAYFASQVSLNITGLAPIAGPVLQHIAQGGGGMGTATINRFFGLHVWLMPAALLMLVGAHLTIFRHNGPAGPAIDDRRRSKPGAFWPDQFFMDAAFSFIVFVIICFLAIALPPYLDAKADPTNSSCRIRRGISYRSSVCWRSCRRRFISALLRSAPNSSRRSSFRRSSCCIVLLLPWLDRSRTRSFAARGGILWTTTIVVGVIIGLSIFGQVETMAKQAAAPPSPPESVVLSEPAAGTSSAGTPGTVPAAQCRHRHGRWSRPTPTAPRCSRRTAPAVMAHKAKALPGAFPPLGRQSGRHRQCAGR